MAAAYFSPFNLSVTLLSIFSSSSCPFVLILPIGRDMTGVSSSGVSVLPSGENNLHCVLSGITPVQL
jgi:hypothetical protein